eukprot:15322756-Alexandrium_andersonii.AAC.1
MQDKPGAVDVLPDLTPGEMAIAATVPRAPLDETHSFGIKAEKMVKRYLCPIIDSNKQSDLTKALADSDILKLTGTLQDPIATCYDPKQVGEAT